jgi:hypothetical protein
MIPSEPTAGALCDCRESDDEEGALSAVEESLELSEQMQPGHNPNSTTGRSQSRRMQSFISKVCSDI